MSIWMILRDPAAAVVDPSTRSSIAISAPLSRLLGCGSHDTLCRRIGSRWRRPTPPANLICQTREKQRFPILSRICRSRRGRRATMSELSEASGKSQVDVPVTPVYRAPIDHPGAWKTADFESPADYTIELNAAQLPDLD